MTSSDLDAPVAVLGATGAQGGAVVRALRDAGRPVRALARTPEKLEELADAGVETRAVELADAKALAGALDGVSGAFVHLPFVPVPELMEGWARAVGAALSAADVPIAVFSSSGPVPSEPTGVVTYDTKLAAGRILRESGAPIVFLQPFTYLDNLSAPFSAPAIVDEGELRYPLPADHRQLWISQRDQAAYALAALERPNLAGRTYLIGQPLTGTELAEALGAALGRAVRYVALDPAAFGASLAPAMGDEVAAVITADYALAARRPATVPFDDSGRAAVRDLGVEPAPVAEWARAQAWPGVGASS